MPFKHESISYDSSITKSYCEDLQCALDLKRKPVGIKLYFDKESYDKSEVKEPKGKLSYCCVVEKATRGMAFKVRLEHINCDGGTIALGLEKSTNKIESGMEYFSYNLYSTPAAAKRMRDGVMGLYRTGVETYGVEVAPLEEMTVTPDVIIFVVNTYEAMRIQQGYVYHTGERITSTFAAMQGICVEATVEPYLTGRMNISTMCPSTRFLAKWKDEELSIGMPYERFKAMVEGVIATINTTDIQGRKEAIVERFNKKNKSAEFIDVNGKGY